MFANGRLIFSTCLLYIFLGVNSLRGQCVGAIGSAYSNVHTVRVTWSSNFATYGSAASNAASMWNDSCGGSMAGAKYPELSASYGSATLNIDYKPFDHAPNLNCANGTEYCRAENNGTTITLYGYSGPPSNLNSWGSLSAATRQRMLAHEFGHSLGLDDGACSGGIMTLPIGGTESILSSECAIADQQNHVPYEGTVNEGCESLQDCHQSPIMINLNGGVYRFTSLEDGVWFDLDGDDESEQVAWTTAGAQTAFLWMDRNANGIVDNAWELFGSVAALNGANGFEMLKVFDRVQRGDVNFGGNGDGVLNERDARWADLKLWVDANHDGFSQAEEIFTLSEKGILAIDLDYSWSGRRDQHGNEFRYRASVLRRTKSGHEAVVQAYDVFLVTRN